MSPPPEGHEPDAASVDERVRRRLRSLRAEQGLTLQEVAARAHLDTSTLSRIETGKRRLALDHLPGLAAALGVSADELLRSPAHADPRVHSEPRHHSGMTMWPLTARGPAAGVELCRVELAASRNQPPDQLPVHEGHAWFYVLAGRLRLLLGEDEHVVVPGEAVEFSTWTPHWFGVLDEPVTMLGSFGPRGEQEHVHR